MGRRPELGGTGAYKGISFYAILVAVNFSRKVQQKNIIRVLVNMRQWGEKKIHESFSAEKEKCVIKMKIESHGAKRQFRASAGRKHF